MKCECCSAKATTHVTYGLYSEHEKGRPHHELNVCPQHLEELGKKCKPAVAVLLMHFVLRPLATHEQLVL